MILTNALKIAHPLPSNENLAYGDQAWQTLDVYPQVKSSPVIIFIHGGSWHHGRKEQYRFAAADHGTPQVRERAISFVLVGGIAAAMIGSTFVIYTRDLFLPVHFAGAYFCVSAMFLLSMVVMSFLKTRNVKQDENTEPQEPPRPLREIASQPRFIVAVLCGTLTFALMSFVMTGAPLAMVGCGISVNNATLGIQWHVFAMFGPSFITGSLINRFGKERIVATGMTLWIICALVALSGLELWKFWLSLIFRH